MVSKVFLDADVVIDFFTDREPHVNPASELFQLNEEGTIQIHLSAVSINNIYYVVRKYLGHKKAIEVIEELTEVTTITGTTKDEITQALRNDFKDFEDSIQYSTALTITDLEVIITRNVKDYRNAQIAVMTPSNYLKMRDEMSA
ncbi:MAG: PIN domain-containing protein [Bacteroidota bacterium]